MRIVQQRIEFDDVVNILIVDDREDGLIALEAILGENPQYRLIKAQSGREAYSLIHDYDFAMILLDVQMPELDGFQTAELIRTQPQFSSIPILFVTAINKDDRYVYRGYQAGAVDYIFKPFDPMILKSKVAVFASLHQQRRLLEAQSIQLREQELLAHQSRLQFLELQSLRRYQTLADAVPHMLWEADADGTITYYNRQCRLYTGLDLTTDKNVTWQRAVHEKDLKNFLLMWMQGIQHRQKFEVEMRIRRYDEVYRWQLVRVVPQLEDDGKLTGWIGTCTDIHDQKMTEQELLEARKTAEAANAAKTQFLANMSHEIRTPLSAIIGFTELMMEENITDEERQSSLSVVRRNSQQLLKIIDEILDISKVEAGGLQLEVIDTDLPSLISGVRSLLNVSAAKKNLQLMFEAEGDLPMRVMTDATRLRQVLVNLIGNSIKFTAHGYVKTTVRWLAKPSGKNYLQISVSDSGVGVPPDFVEKIFLPFLQADSSTTRLYGGTGLGLTLSRKLARALGGDLWLESSTVGVGSTFIAEFEVQHAENHRWFQSFDDFDRNQFDRHEMEGQNLRGARILLVEDAEDNQVLISHFLSQQGAQIDIARNGLEAVEKALANDYQAVLMDIQMPVMDGYEATSRLRKAGYKRPIIALTAHALAEERNKSLRTGCNAHMTKPLDRKQLIARLAEYITVPPEPQESKEDPCALDVKPM